MLRKEDGSEAYLFTTTKEPYELKRIRAGDYYLCEVEAPDGYEVAADAPFTVTGTADESATVTMVDKRETPTEADLTVTKTITDISNFPLMASGNVRTGDDTPVAAVAAVFAVAGVAVILLVASGMRKRKKK